MLALAAFPEKDEVQLQKARFRVNPKIQLSPYTSLDFNGVKLTAQKDNILLQQKGRDKRLEIIDICSD